MNPKITQIFFAVLLIFSCASLNAQLPHYDSEKSTLNKDVSNYWVPSYQPQLRYPNERGSGFHQELGSGIFASRRAEFRRNDFRRIEGCVEIEYIISKEGKAQNIEIVAEYPNGIYVDIVLDTIRRYKWQATAENISRIPINSNARFIFHNPSLHPLHQDAVCDWPEQPKPEPPKNCRDSKKSRLLKTCD